MKKLFSNVLSKLGSNLNQRILLIFTVSLLWVIIYKIFLVDMPPMFLKAYALGEIFYGLLSSVIASCIFYYFVVYLEQRRVAKVLNPNLKQRLLTFRVGYYMILNAIAESKGLVLQEPNSHEALHELTKGISLRSQPPLFHGHRGRNTRNWFEYFERFFESDDIIIKQLYAYAAYLPPTVLQKLDELFFPHLRHALHDYYMQPNEEFADKLENLSGNLMHYLATLKVLIDYAENDLD